MELLGKKKKNPDIFMVLRYVFKMFSKRGDGCDQPLEQDVHMAAATPTLRKRFAGKSSVAQIGDPQEALGLSWPARS